jgi:hypothetical protein
MSVQRLPDCRTPGQQDGSTSSAHHPELLSGYLAIRPILRPPLSSSEQASYVMWSRRSMMVVILGVVGIIGWPLLQGALEGVLPHLNVMIANAGW